MQANNQIILVTYFDSLGNNFFLEPQAWNWLDSVNAELKVRGVCLLQELHGHENSGGKQPLSG